jgi:hypothetical protein
MTGSRFSNAEKHREAVREVAYRRRSFARWVSDKKMRQEHADLRIAIMQEIADDYRRLAQLDEPKRKFPD